MRWRICSYISLWLITMALCPFAHAQFRGGNGDGSVVSIALNTVSLGRNIFLGGNGDGSVLATTLSSQSLGQNIFHGGNGDGNVLAATLNSQSLGQNIFLGGKGDGNILATTLTTQNLGINIFHGGADDGFAMAFLTNAALPVTLVSFNAAWQSNDIVTKWITSTEANTDYFEVERSIDGNNFTAVGKTKAAGNSTSTNTYSFTDAAVNKQYSTNPTKYYYRLKTIDLDGKYQYSAIVALSNLQQQDAILYSLYPNPANQQLIVECKNLNKQYSLKVLSVNQQVMVQKEVASQKETINVSAFAAGIYFVQIVDIQSKSVQTFKILVQH